MSNNRNDGDKLAKQLLNKYPFIGNMWAEREKLIKVVNKKESLIENKYNKIAKKAGLKSLKFAYSDGYCFGIDVNDVEFKGTNLNKNRLLVHDSLLEDIKEYKFLTRKELKVIVRLVEKEKSRAKVFVSGKEFSRYIKKITK